MYTAWTKHIKDPEEVAAFERKVLSAKEILDKIKDLLKEEEASLERSELDIKSFDQPNWDYRQAYKNGYRASLHWITKLIDLDQQKGTK